MYTQALNDKDQPRETARPEDAARLQRFQATIDAEEKIEPNDWIEVRRDRLVVRREERDRVEASSKKTLGLVDRFEHSGDYRDVRIGSLELTLGTVQANVVRALHAAALSDQPWCAGKALLRDAGATSMRMRDAFKSQKEWPRLIESDNRGRYRLRLKPE